VAPIQIEAVPSGNGTHRAALELESAAGVCQVTPEYPPRRYEGHEASKNQLKSRKWKSRSGILVWLSRHLRVLRALRGGYIRCSWMNEVGNLPPANLACQKEACAA
jgi:hypothetical protein